MEKQKIELRLLIPTGVDRAGWSLELVLPTCRECRATVSLDVGGRIQTLNMRGMQTSRRRNSRVVGRTLPHCLILAANLTLGS